MPAITCLVISRVVSARSAVRSAESTSRERSPWPNQEALRLFGSFGPDGVKNHIGSEQPERGVQMHQLCPPLGDVLLKLEDLTRGFGALVP